MAEHTCHTCMYSFCDAGLWLRRLWAGEPILASCANHPRWPGRMREVPGVPCRNYRPKPALPGGADVRLIPLGDGFYAYVDAADYQWLSQWQWHMHGGYAARREKGKRVYMHRQIMHPRKDKLVDHVDGNRANNCRSNLRICNHKENQRNQRKQAGARSRFKGVYYDKRCSKWFAQCWYAGRLHALGFFGDQVEAARAYDRAAAERFGEFARLNFPEEWPPQRRLELRAARKRERKKVRTQEGKNTARRPRQSSIINPKASGGHTHPFRAIHSEKYRTPLIPVKK
jgi:hypothetical protein